MCVVSITSKSKTHSLPLKQVDVLNTLKHRVLQNLSPMLWSLSEATVLLQGIRVSKLGGTRCFDTQPI